MVQTLCVFSVYDILFFCEPFPDKCHVLSAVQAQCWRALQYIDFYDCPPELYHRLQCFFFAKRYHATTKRMPKLIVVQLRHFFPRMRPFDIP